eukprot:CAMPEP_0168575824 /NCGR_PEP_ID=MMETSP0413-20121227/19906_1 /TAXON_ID=136452 /ORGANISM="Filamoeba nolandi, Strain NC-AS-23-1" /LENGTH=44 /DNA_ID= /DNA_START= /DNA_END= /DNA_ORIENTATION=
MKKDMENPELFWKLYGSKQKQLEEDKKRSEGLSTEYVFDPEIEV